MRALTLDHLYGQYLSRGPRGLRTGVRMLLRLGSYQHYYLSRIPDYAIVNEILELGRQVLRFSQKESGFLNAVLRKVAADDGDIESMLPVSNSVSALSVRHSYPREVAGLLVENYGGLKASEIMAACNEESTLTLRVNTLKTAFDSLKSRLKEDGFGITPGHLAPEAVIAVPIPGSAEKSLFETSAFYDGLFYAQDEGSQLVAHLARPWCKGRVLDLCAAPGGKTTHLAEITGGNLDIIATDSSERRLAMVQENLTRLGTPGVRVLPLNESLAGAPYDTVLVDAPCSGLGTARRNPEVRYRITTEALARHQDRQVEVLNSAASVLTPGGAIVYSTCSVSRQENRDVIARFLKEHPDFALASGSPSPPDDISHQIYENLQSKTAGIYSTWPAYRMLDGFEAAVFLHKESP